MMHVKTNVGLDKSSAARCVRARAESELASSARELLEAQHQRLGAFEQRRRRQAAMREG